MCTDTGLLGCSVSDPRQMLGCKRHESLKTWGNLLVKNQAFIGLGKDLRTVFWMQFCLTPTPGVYVLMWTLLGVLGFQG